LLVLGGAALVLVLTACGSHRAAGPAGSLVSVKESDYRIVLRPSRVPAGRVRVTIDNIGPANHEMILVRALPDGLPLRTDGLTVNEEAITPREVVALEPAVPGTVRHVDVDLPKGEYEVFCNMAGHFMGGMRAFLTVT
jgi:uncharacterized cupredoxin-like copper-binding protein